MNEARPWLGTGEILDGITNSMIMIGLEHHKVHEGHSYKTDINTLDLDSNSLTISFKTPSTANLFVHLVILADTTGEARLDFFEGCTATNGGSIPIYNRDRTSTNTSAVIATHATSVGFATHGATIAGGIRLHHELFGSGKDMVGGSNRDVLEWILKANTIYAVEMTSSTNSIVAQLSLRWYEHTNSNVA